MQEVYRDCHGLRPRNDRGNMFATILFFVFGFTLLLKGADILIDAAASFAKRCGLANFVIGVLVIGIGASLPEFFVTIFSNLQHLEKIGLGTVIGSNIFNILIILGVTALIYPVVLTKSQLWHHLPVNIFAVFIIGFFVLISGSFFGITRIAGFLLILFFISWVWYLHFLNKYLLVEEHYKYKGKTNPTFFNIISIIGALIGIIVGGQWVVQGATGLAELFGLSETVIGLMIVGPGTSLPEVFVSIVAAKKKNYGMAVGNIIGSNIFDFLLILGLASVMKPLIFTTALFIDLWIAFFSSILLFAVLAFGKKYVITRPEGFMFIILYIFYILYVFFSRTNIF